METITAAVRSALRAVLLLVCIPAVACSQPEAHLAIDAREHHQKMAGWEVTARALEFDKGNDRFDGSWLAQRDAFAAMLVDEAGIDRLRLEIKSGMENPVDYWSLFAAGKIGYRAYKDRFYEKINDNDDPAALNPTGIHFSDMDWHVENIVLPVQKRLEARGRRLRLNLAYVDFGWTPIKGTLSHAKNPAEYAELVTERFLHLKAKYGLVPDSLEIIVEPDNSDNWRGVEIGKAIVATAARLEAAGFHNVEIIAPSTAKAQRALEYFGDIKRVPGAVAHMHTLAYHRYDGVPDAQDLDAIRKAARGAKLTTAMLEYVDGGVGDLLADLGEADAASWQKYGIAARQRTDGTASPGWLIVTHADPGAPLKLRLTRTARALGLIFGVVDQGSVRVGARSNTENLAAASFLTPGDRLIVAFQAATDMPVALTGLRPGRYSLAMVANDEAGTLTSREIEVAGPLHLQAVANATYRLAQK